MLKNRNQKPKSKKLTTPFIIKIELYKSMDLAEYSDVETEAQETEHQDEIDLFFDRAKVDDYSQKLPEKVEEAQVIKKLPTNGIILAVLALALLFMAFVISLNCRKRPQNRRSYFGCETRIQTQSFIVEMRTV
jgi:hypothetical protein